MRDLFKAFKPLLSDFLSTIVFVLLLSITDNIVLSVLAGIAVGVVQLIVEWRRGLPIQAMQWASLALVAVLGSATLLTNDLRFAMLKPSIANFAIGCVMLRSNWMGRYLPAVVKEHLPPATILIWGYVWAGLELLLAAVNLYVAFALGKKIWLEYTAIVPLAAQLLLFFVQYAWIRAAVIRTVRAQMTAHPVA